jgi:hypothetical protein
MRALGSSSRLPTPEPNTTLIFDKEPGEIELPDTTLDSDDAGDHSMLFIPKPNSHAEVAWRSLRSLDVKASLSARHP